MPSQKPHHVLILLLWLTASLVCPATGLAQESPKVTEEADGMVRKKVVKETPAEDESPPKPQRVPNSVPDKKAAELTREEEDSLFKLDARDTLGRDAEGRRASIERSREKDIAMMSEQELLNAGFVFGDRARDSRVRSTATLLALTAGSAVHGVGHWYMGDRDTGIALAFMEAAGVIIAGVAGLAPMAYGSDFGVSPYSRHLLYFGAGLFGASYVLDVIGTAQGAEQLSFKNSTRIKGAAATVRYGYLELNDYPLRNVLQGGVELDIGRVYMSGMTLQDVGLSLSQYGGAVGVRLWRSSRWPQTTVFLQADTAWLEFRGLARFERLDVSGQAGLSLDLGMFSKNMSQIVLGIQSGYMHQWYAFPATTQYNPLQGEQPPAEWSYNLGGLPFDMFVHFNLSERMHARFAYTRRDGGLLQGTDDYLAVPSLQINYRSTEKLDIELKAEVGSGVGLWGGFKYWMWQGESLRRRKRAPSTADAAP